VKKPAGILRREFRQGDKTAAEIGEAVDFAGWGAGFYPRAWSPHGCGIRRAWSAGEHGGGRPPDDRIQDAAILILIKAAPRTT
jgi:hypothetical protein